MWQSLPARLGACTPVCLCRNTACESENLASPGEGVWISRGTLRPPSKQLMCVALTNAPSINLRAPACLARSRLPQCYYISPPALKTAFFQKFTDMTLFYIFYHFLTRPTDQPHAQLRESLVKFAYQELVARGWQHQQPNNVWVTHSRDTNELKYFDMRAMEMRPFVPGQVGCSLSLSSASVSTRPITHPNLPLLSYLHGEQGVLMC